jgi:hypothetical protein
MRDSLVRLLAWCLVPAAVCALVTVSVAQTPPPPESQAISSPAAAQPGILQLKDGTPVRLRTTTFISSKNAKQGDEVRFRVAENVKVGDLVVVQRSAVAVGLVASVHRSRRRGIAGKISLEIRTVDLINGKTAPLRAQESRKGRGHSGEIADTALNYPAGPLVAPFALLLHGEEVEIPPNTVFIAHVDGDLPLDQSELQRVQPPLPPATGLATVYILRPQVPPTISPPVYCGLIEIGKLRKGEYVAVRVLPGDYLFQSTDPKRKVQLKVEAEQTYYLALNVSYWGSKGLVELVDKDRGDDAVAVLAPSATQPQLDLSSADQEKLHSTSPPPQPKPPDEEP